MLKPSLYSILDWDIWWNALDSILSCSASVIPNMLRAVLEIVFKIGFWFFRTENSFPTLKDFLGKPWENSLLKIWFENKVDFENKI